MAWVTGGRDERYASRVPGGRRVNLKFLKFFSLGLRGKLALAALVLLALPWVGWQYVQEMEGFLLDAQEQTLLGTARAVSTALHERPRLLQVRPVQKRAPGARPQPGVEGELSLPPDFDEEPRELGNETNGVNREGEVAAILKGIERSTSRIWVVNREFRVIALAGSLKRAVAPVKEVGWPEHLMQLVIANVLQHPSEDFDEATPEDVLSSGREVIAALQGAPRTRIRQTSDGKAAIVSAAHPIWSTDEVIGAVVVEESTNSILSVRNQALERLLFATLAAFVIAGAVLLGLATRISWRIRRLRDEAEGAIDAQGRFTHVFSGSNAGDEIGDLSRSFSSVLGRLAEHHSYLETMASRLSHELRTPVAVVRSSLENLKLEPSPAESRIYLQRAEQGLARLSTILTRMSEATRLEQGLLATERERFDLALVTSGCVEGYRSAFYGRVFVLSMPDSPVMVEGSPELIAQMLDKLVDNANDFGTPGTPISVKLERTGVAPELGNAGSVVLCIANLGDPLPEGTRQRLFASMVSMRRDRGGEKPHLGLGLYVARLIAEFHRGTIQADNLADGQGVAVTVTFKAVT
ncbi:MAG: ATP-binding protein [Burkholderiales bacterium]